MRTTINAPATDTCARLQVLLADNIEVLKMSDEESMRIREFDALFDEQYNDVQGQFFPLKSQNDH